VERLIQINTTYMIIDFNNMILDHTKEKIWFLKITNGSEISGGISFNKLLNTLWIVLHC